MDRTDDCRLERSTDELAATRTSPGTGSGFVTIGARQAEVWPETKRVTTSTPSEPSDNDAVLFRRYRDDGDVAAFERLFARHRNTLIQFLWSLSGNQTVAEDVSQYCWTRLMEGAYEPRPGATIIAWLRTTGRNRYIDEYTRRHEASRTEAVENSDPRLGAAASALESAALEETRATISNALAALPLEQRDVIAMWLQGFSIKEMMAATKVPRDTVLSRKKYALKKLKQAFSAAGVTWND